MNYTSFLSSLQERSFQSICISEKSPIFKEDFFDLEDVAENPLNLSFQENQMERSQCSMQDWLFLSDPLSCP
jgi:hypothetical protein